MGQSDVSLNPTSEPEDVQNQTEKQLRLSRSCEQNTFLLPSGSLHIRLVTDENTTRKFPGQTVTIKPFRTILLDSTHKEFSVKCTLS